MDKWVLRPWEGNKSKHLQTDFECGRHTHDEVPQPGRLVARMWIEATTDDDSARYIEMTGEERRPPPSGIQIIYLLEQLYRTEFLFYMMMTPDFTTKDAGTRQLLLVL